MLRTTKSLRSKDISLFICTSVFALAFLLFLLRHSLSRPPSPSCRRRFLGVSVAGNRRNRFFLLFSPSRDIAFFVDLSFSLSLSFFPCFFSSFCIRSASDNRTRSSGGKPVTIGLNSAIIAGGFASTLQTQTDVIPRPNGCILISRPSETRLLIRSPDFLDVYCFRIDTRADFPRRSRVSS